ncbi:SusC/RagA family TonB-linked outer membrane protein [Pseudozobellia thermophila]|uniref:TonB-linked outer membrane protein, SusC/RagA family n=1 Tax=Pseudozobellia thermophila TaxID=192903 RepID=A0A1M6GII2_9FLAO|nr:TonB-dependent receptor [Pseudozobellia thermophila]SHJ09767.1 TonB-linked outer membrane protein, SusC/RagA family [Pseudozobellia thermophila]
MRQQKFKLRALWFALCPFFLGAGIALGQQVQVSGTVSDNQGPLPGVSVIVKGTNNGTVTDFDGKYSIKAEASGTLIFSYIGYKTEEIAIGGRQTINLSLEENVSALEEVVVVGYGAQKKKELTGAVAQVKSEELLKTSTADIGTALQGQIAGVNVTASSGAPGSEANVMIRGLTSINGANRPLYVVDGVPFDGDPKLSINEIETIDVLKDGASAAIYGTRGAAGVILITTKKGKEGQMKISLDSYYGLQHITSATPLLNVEDKLYTTFLQGAALNNSRYGNTWTTIQQSPHLLTNNTNLVEAIENNMAPTQNHSLTLSGGRDGLTYSITGNYYDQEGVIIKSGYDRFNVRANSQFVRGNWNISTGISFRIEDREYAPWGLLLNAIKYNPYQPYLDPEASVIENAGDGTDANNLSYLGYLFLQEDNQENNYFDGNLNITYNFTDNLKITSRIASSYDNGTRITINPKFVAYRDDGSPVTSQRSKVKNLSSLAKKFTWENILNYQKSFGDHNINLTGVYSAEKYSYSEFFAEKSDLVSNDITVLNGATADPNVGSGNNPWTQNRESTLIGMLARLQYNYKGKYLLSGAVRRDGSSRFKEEPWGVFPSLSAGWNVSDEKFWNPLKNTVSSFKLRGSRGTTGNQGIADYSFTPTITLDNDYVLGAGDYQNLVLGATQTGFANPKVRWETSVSLNGGFDLGFFDNKLTLSGDIYETKKQDMLFPVLLPPSAGGGKDAEVTLNVGDMTNKGVEFAMNYRHSGELSWNAGLTYTRNENIITKMSLSNKIIYFDDSSISGHDNDQDLVSAIAEGYEGGAFFLIETDGTIKTEEELAKYQEIVPDAQLGDLKYIDYDNNGTIDINDRQYMGSGTPDYEMGLNFSAYYKNIDFSMQWYGSFGAEIINGNKALAYKVGNHQDLVYQWTPQNNTSDIPVNRNATHNNYRGQTDYWLEDGTFVRLRNISLGYTIPKEYTEVLGIAKFRVYVAAQNPLTITKYDGYDPEVGNNGLSTRGIDKGTYPVSSQIRTGLQIEF